MVKTENSEPRVNTVNSKCSSCEELKLGEERFRTLRGIHQQRKQAQYSITPWTGGRHIGGMRNVLQASRRRAGEGKGRKNGTFPRIHGRHPGCQEAGTTEKIIPKPEGEFHNESVNPNESGLRLQRLRPLSRSGPVP